MPFLDILNYLLLFSIGFAIYAKARRWVLIYWLCIIPIFFPVSVFVTRSFLWDSFVQLRYQMVDFGKYYLAILIVFRMFQKSLPNLKYLYFFVFLWLFYYVIDTFIIHEGYDWVIFRITITELFTQLLMLIYILLHKKWMPTSTKVIKTLVVLIYVQFFFTVLQMFGIYIYPCFYLTQYMNTIMGEQVYADDSLITGTFFRYNAMANFLTTAYLFLALEYYSKKIVSTKQFFCLSISVFTCVLLSGAKASLVLLVVVSVLCICKYSKRNRGLFLLTIMSVVIGYFLIPVLIKDKVETGFYGLDRMINGLAQSIINDSEDSGDTTSLSTYLLGQYFGIDPFFGVGYSYKGELGYGNLGVCTLSAFDADAKLAYIMVETGIVGMILYIFVFGSVFQILLKYCKKEDRIKIFICIIYYVLLNFTESGVFERICFPMMYIYVFCVLNKKNTGNVQY